MRTRSDFNLSASMSRMAYIFCYLFMFCSTRLFCMLFSSLQCAASCMSHIWETGLKLQTIKMRRILKNTPSSKMHIETSEDWPLLKNYYLSFNKWSAINIQNETQIQIHWNSRYWILKSEKRLVLPWYYINRSWHKATSSAIHQISHAASKIDTRQEIVDLRDMVV